MAIARNTLLALNIVIVTTDRNGWATWKAAPPAAWSGTKWINLDVGVDTGEFATWRIAK